MITAVPVAYAAHAARASTEMRFACAKQGSGQLRYVTRARDCRTSTERLIRFRDAGPSIACADRGGFVYRVPNRAACKRKKHRPSLVLVLPGDAREWFCADKRSGKLRSTQHAPYGRPRPPHVGTSACRGDERRVFVEQGNRRPHAVGDSATVDEDHAGSIPVLANDSDPEGDALTVASVNPGGAKGSVAIAADRRSVSYDPNGRFEVLGAGARATERFTYRATDGHLGNSAAVTVTVTGVNDRPVVSSSAGAAAYTEGAAATTIDGGLTVADVDDASLEGARVRISAGFESGDDLVFASQNGISGSYDNTTGVLTLTGSSLVANYEAALRSVKYRHTGENPAALKTVEFRVDDGDGLGPASTRNVDVTPVNDAPTVATSSGSATFIEADGPVAVDPGVAVADPDSALLSGATVAITSSFTAGEDSLGFTNQNGITGTYDAGTGVLTLSGATTVEDYRTALRSVTYANGSNNPSTATRTVSIQVTDTGALTSNVATRDVTVAGSDDAPIVTATAAPLAYTENAAGTAVDPGVTISDADDASLEGATIRIASGFESGDVLGFTTQNGITGSYNSGTGVLTLTGTSLVANYETALRSVEYSQTGDNPATSKAVEFNATDGFADSAPAIRAISVTRVNDAPALDTTNAALAYAEGAGPVAADAGIAVTDPDSTQIQGATVQITSNFVAAQDELAFAPQFGITRSYDDTTGTLTLSGTASVASYQAALRAVTYENGSDNPSPPARTLTFLATDAEGATSAPATRDITLGAANDGATITTTAAALAYTEDDPATAIDAGLTVTDPDDTNLEGATVRLSAGFQSADELLFTDQLGITGSYDSGTGVLTLTGTSSVADYQTALRSVRYRHNGDDPSAVKTVEFRADDGDGLGSASTRNIAVTPANDAPTVTTSGGSVAWTEGGGPVAIDGGLTVTDPDSTQLSGATVSISSDFSSAQDALALVDQVGITDSYEPATGVLTLTGTTSVANYQTALRLVTYDNGSDDPAPATRTISFQVTDSGAAASNAATRGIAVAGANDAPVVTTSGGSTAYTEGASAVAVDGGLTVSDVDDSSLEGATVRVSAGFDAGDALEFTNQNGITGSYSSGTGVLTLLGTSSVANYETALRSVGLSSTNDNPALSKTVEFTANDGDADSAPAAKSIAVTRVNDGPQITTTGSSLAYTENDGPVAIDSGLVLADPDSTQISGATVQITSSFQATQDDLGFVNQLGITGLYDDFTGELALSGTASVADYQTALRSVTYVNVSEGPTPLTRTISFQATDDGSAASNIATRGISITPVNDPPTAVADTGTTDEDTTLNVSAPGVLANDTDVDPGDTKTVALLNGSATLTQSFSGGRSVTINANGSYTFDPGSFYQGLTTGQSDTFSFTYTMADGAAAQSTATVTITITGVSDAPTAVPDSFNAIGNTGLFVGTTRPAGEAGKEITGSVLSNDTDPDTPQASLVAEPVTNAPTTLGGTITIESDGNFTYQPDDADTAVTDTFTYRVCDASPCNSGTVANATGTLSLPIDGQVWYVRNNAAAGGDGTSDGPFDTLVEAETASGTGDSVYVFDGDNTATGYGGDGYAMNAGERLIGEHEGLQVDPDGGGPLTLQSLHPGSAGAHPTLTGVNADVISLDDGNEVRGVDVDPEGTGGGIEGGAGDTGGGTIDDVNIVDNGTAGTQPGLELDATTGTFDVSNLVVDNKATGVRLNNAGTVDFGTTSITTAGAKGLDATATNMGTSTFDRITVTASGTGGVSMVNTTGTTTLGDGNGSDLSLTTTSGSSAAFLLNNNAGTVTVGGGGTDNLSATGGPAIDVTGTAGATLDFDDVDSTNSAGDGIKIAGLGAGTFSSQTGTIAGAAGIAFDLDGGSGAISYPGALNNGAGATAAITNRGGGAVTLSGAIADTSDAGGGITLSGNSGGSTTFSNASKVINTTGGGDAVVMSSSDGHTLTLSGGGLDIDAAGGKGLEATTSGAIAVSGTGNTIDTTTGRALNIANTDIGAADVTFQRISANGALNGIALDNTGAAGGLTVTGTGSGGTGGTIQNTTSDSLLLTSTRDVSLAFMNVQNSAESGILGTGVTNLNLTSSSFTNNGDDSGDVGIKVSNLLGTSAWNSLSVTGSELANVFIDNTSGTLDSLAVSGASHFDNLGTAFGGNSFLVDIRGTAVMESGSIDGATFVNNKPARGITVQAQDIGRIGNAAANSFTVQNSTFTNNGLQASFEQSGTANLTFKLLNNGTPVVPMTMPNTAVGTSHAVNVFSSSTSTGGTIRGRISGNRIGDAAVVGSGSAIGNGIRTLIQGKTAATLLYDSNTIRQIPQARGIDVQLLGPLDASGAPTSDITLTNNDVNPQDSTGFPTSAIYVAADSQGGGTVTVRTDIRGNTVPLGAAIDSLPTFLALDEVVPAAVCQLVNTTASPNATAQLIATNTGSASAAAGCALIAGPITTPP